MEARGEGFAARYRVEVEKDGVTVVDETLARLLLEVRRRGSLLAAARALGVSYSRAWERLARAERAAGAPLVEARRGGRGGGGARLTRLGERLLQLYQEAVARLERCGIPHGAPLEPSPGEPPELLLAHSSDHMVELVVERLRGSGVRVEAACVGSGRALALLAAGEADAACMHLLDPETGLYNRPFLERSWLPDAPLLGGYERQLVLALRPGLEERYTSLEEALEAAARGRLRLARRNRGSGTMLLLSRLLQAAAARLGLPGPQPRWVGEAYTHEEAARLVALGRADAALVLRLAADRYGLPWLHASWERYECYAHPDRASSRGVEALRSLLQSGWLRRLVEGSPGYRPLDSG